MARLCAAGGRAVRAEGGKGLNNRDIRKLLSQKTVTGEEVGQALIRDMVCLYVDANTGRTAEIRAVRTTDRGDLPL